jgi:hypothetical protein
VELQKGKVLDFQHFDVFRTLLTPSALKPCEGDPWQKSGDFLGSSKRERIQIPSLRFYKLELQFFSSIWPFFLSPGAFF